MAPGKGWERAGNTWKSLGRHVCVWGNHSPGGSQGFIQPSPGTAVVITDPNMDLQGSVLPGQPPSWEGWLCFNLLPGPPALNSQECEEMSGNLREWRKWNGKPSRFFWECDNQLLIMAIGKQPRCFFHTCLAEPGTYEDKNPSEVRRPGMYC